MSLRHLAAPLLALLLLPLAQAQAPDAPPGEVPASSMSIAAGAVAGLAKDDNGQMVAPFRANLTVPVTVTLGCSLLLYASVANSGDAGHIHVMVENPPAWLLADELEIEPVGPADCAGEASGMHAYTGTFPFALAANAPAVVPVTLNLTAGFAGVETAETAPVTFAVRFHSDYAVTPSIQFPHTVTGRTANFTVTITNTGNARSMVMVEQVRASTGTFSGLGSLVYQPPETKTFQVTFKAPDACWTTAKVEFHTASHYLLLNQQAGSYKDERDYTWDLSNGVPCTPGKSETSKASPAAALALLPALLGAALLARRRPA